MAEFILGRIKFVYRNNWASSTAYVVDDVVTKGGKTFICTVNHTSSSIFDTDYDLNPAVSKWNLLADGQQWREDWAASTAYNEGDLVKYGGIVYICNEPHTSATYTSPTWLGLENDQAKWDVFATSFDWKGAWATSTRYKVNDIVSYNGYTYICTTKHTSAATATLGLEDNSGDWQTVNPGIKYLGSWEDLGASYRYKVNDLVKYGASLWICTAAHTSTTAFEDGDWTIFLNGFEFENTWDIATVYQLGDIVTYGGYSYVAKQNNTGRKPSAEPTYWDVYTTGFSFEGDWTNLTSYKIGSVIRNGGYTYLAELDSPSISTTATATTVSTDPTNPNTISADTTGFVAGMTVYFGSSFGGLVANTKYYILSSGLTSSRFKVSTIPGGSAVTLTTTTSQSVSVTASAEPENTTYWSKLNPGFKWKNNTATYTGVSGTVQGASLGVGATFDVTRTGTVYTVEINDGGSYFVAGDQIKILGTSLGGISPANDLMITVTTASSGVITAETHEGISVTWTSGIVYVLGDVVFFGASSYTCVTEHVASSGTRPDNDVTATYWNIVSVGAEAATLTTAGDTLYYSPNGPTRLPIGSNGQVLRVKDGYPSWETYGHVFNAVFVGPTGIDLPYPQSGFSIDQPWKTVRFACKQIEEGYREPQAKHILQTNKAFLIKETFNYLEYTYKTSVTGTSGGAFLTTDTSMLNLKMPIVFAEQTGSLTLNGNPIVATTVYYIKSITEDTSFTVSATPTGTTLVGAGTGTAVATFEYDRAKAKRDAGIVIEGMIYDLTHGGNLKTTTNTLAFYDNTGTAYITTNTELQIAQFIGSHEYLRSIVPSVLANTAVSTSYQTLNGETEPIYQIIDNDYTAESGVVTRLNELFDILIDGLTQGDTSTTALAKTPNTTISIKTGTYQEVLPIVVPEYTALVGDELRSTVVQPKGGNNILINDQPKTKAALERVKAVLPNVLSNTALATSEDNTETQQFLYTTEDNTATASITSNTNAMVDILVNGNTAAPAYVLPTPTSGTGNASDAGYFNAARLVNLNRQFIIDEIEAYMVANQSATWTGLSADQKAACKRDVGLIVDGLRYDLTYGGNLATVIAARSYYSKGVFVESIGEKPAALAAQLYLKSFIDNIVTGDNSGWVKLSSSTQNVTGTAGSAGAATFAQARIQEIHDTIDTGTSPTTIDPDITWPAAGLLTLNTSIVDDLPHIQSETQAWIQDAYPTLPYDIVLCDRDIGYFVDALRYDMMFGSNFLSVWNAESYNRALTSTTFVIENQLEAEIGMIGFLSAALKEITGGGTAGSAGSFRAIRRVESAAKTVYNIIASGFVGVPSIQFTTPTGYNTSALTDTAYAATGYATGDTTGFGDGKAQLVQNYDFIVADVLQFYANGSYSAVWASTTTEGRDKGKRDIRYILDALQHDMTYGGNYQSSIAGSSYYSSYLLNISEEEKPAFLDAFAFMKTLVGQIVREDSITAQSGNTVTRVTTGPAGSAAAGAFAEDRIQDVIDWITDGEAPTQIAPYYGWASTSLQNSYNAVVAKRSEIALDATGWVQKYYQEVLLDLSLTTRDAELIIDAVALDMVLGTNFNALSAGRAYLRGTASTEALLNGPIKDPTLGAVDFIKFKVKTIAAYGAIAQTQSILTDIINKTSSNFTPKLQTIEPVLPAGTYSAVSGTNVVGSGSSATFNFVRTAAGFTASVNSAGSGYATNDQIRISGANIGGGYTNVTANDITLLVTAVSGSGITSVKVLTDKEAVVLLEDNREFILSEVIAYIDATYPSLVYNKDLTVRDAGYILDAVRYDLIYGGDFASQQAGQAYYTFAESQISTYVKTATLDAIDRINTVAQAVVQNSTVTPTTGNTKTQVVKNGAQLQGSAATATAIDGLITKIYNYVDLGLTAGAPSITVTAISGSDTFTSVGHGLAAGDYIENLGSTANGVTSGVRFYVSSVGLSADEFKLAYDLGNPAPVFTNGTGLTLSLHYTKNPYTGWVHDDLVTEYETLTAARYTITANVVTWIDENYPNLDYDSALAVRDAGLALDAACFDFMFNSNYRGVKGAQSYARPQSAELLKGTLAKATRESFKYLTEQILDTITNETARTRARKSLLYVIDYLAGKSVDEDTETNGTTVYNINEGVLRGVEILRANTAFLANESSAWTTAKFGALVSSTSSTGNLITTATTHNLTVGDPVAFTFTEYNVVATASSSTTGRFTLSSTEGFAVGMPVTFSGTPLFGGVVASTQYFIAAISGNEISVASTNNGAANPLTDGAGIMSVTVGGLMGGVSASTTYYVLTTPSITSLTVTAEQFSTTPITLTDMVGQMHVGYYFDVALCKRDMTEFVHALVYDTQYTGNYKSKRAARLYFNAIKGSKKSDMWHVRNGTGVRNMTMNGIEGTLSIPNKFGTRRPESGSYTSLDPGYGPYDTNAWVNNRSCYVQNCTLFGTGATALKIDGALHAGGNRSIVANDYTTFISDGIGTWCSGSNSLTELVSVFAYYSYAGYIADLGAKIRATNGNSSYGTYGVVAEGVDTYEAPIYGTLNNRGAEAYITNVVTDGAEEVLRIEFANAGQEYTNVEWNVSGSGYNIAAIGDEFRDRAVTETRLIDLDDGYGYGGSGYITAANAAQISGIGTIVIAASDTQLSQAYVGMRVLLTAGTGTGQSAAILTYNNGSKEAKIFKESFTTLTVTDTNAGTDVFTVASGGESLYVNMPIYLGSAIGGASANTLYYITAKTGINEFTLSTSLGGGTLDVTSTTTGQTVSLYAAGWDHIVPGKPVYDALDLTTTYIIEPRISYTGPGFTSTARTLPTTAAWQNVTYSAGRFIAIADGSTASATSTNGTTWSAAGALPSSSNWVEVVYGGGEGATATAVVGGLGGIGAELEAVITAGQVTAVRIIEGGFGYLTPPTIVFSSGLAQANAIVLNGAIVSVEVTIPGSGYITAPTVTARTDIISSFTINTNGKNYTSAPLVTVSGGGSSNQATGTAVLNTNNGVASITVGNDGGSGYTSQPTVTILDSNAKFVAIPATASGGTTKAAYQTVAGAAAGSAWTASTGALPNGTYSSIAYGGGYWVAVGGTATGARSVDGDTTWNAVTLPTLSLGSYSDVAYGQGVFIAISSGDNQTAVSSNSGSTWAAGGTLPASVNWTSIAYGNGRFVAISATVAKSAISIDKGTTWVESAAGMPLSAGNWTDIAYGQGLFVATAPGVAYCATSPDGLNWTLQSMPSSSNWNSVAFGNPGSNPIFAAISSTSGTIAASIRTGAKAQGRAEVASGTITEIRMIEPGSGYPYGSVTATTASTNVITTGDTTNLTALQPVEFTGLDAYGLVTGVTYFVTTGSIVTNTSFKVSADTTLAAAGTAVTLTTGTGLSGAYQAGPIVTQVDPNRIRTAPTRVRMANGTLANPTFTNRGNLNTTATASASGDGFSDLYQASNFINVSGLYNAPKAGANVEFASIPNTWFKLVAVTNILGDPGNYSATFQINPALSVLNAPDHGDAITTRLAYSQVRLTGHDFLYIGTGNFSDTNYPFVDPSTAIQANQTFASEGGRVFFTSTDQDGNFNVGNLFAVQQATGTATLNASAFNLSGLQSLQLGTVSVGAGSAVITSFSTDPYFTANSDNILPTQKAVKSYITAQIGGGQSSLNVNTLTSGVIYVANNTISTTSGVQINVRAKMYFQGGIDGDPVALAYFMQR